MKPSQLLIRDLSLLALLVAASPVNAALIHEYSFNDATGSTTVTDSVGNATGTLTGCRLGGGQITLNGAGDYIHLPSGILPNLTNATFEFWTTWSSPPGSGVTRFFDFGTNNGTSGVQWINVSPDGQNNTLQYPRFVINDGSGNPANASTSFPVGQNVCVTAVYNDSGQVMSLYLNGASIGPIASATTTKHIYTIANDANDNIGKSQFATDPTYNGSFDEFRIYNNAFDPSQVEADYEAGPNVATASPGSLTAINFNAPTNITVGGVITPVILGTYSALTNQVNITSLAGSYSSDNTNVISFGTDGNFHAVALGTTIIRASYNSQNAALSVTVVLQPAALVHRYGFNDAANTADGATITDSVGGANGTFHNPGSSSDGLNGSGQLVLSGNSSTAYVTLPSGILPQLTNATFEIWADEQNHQTWEELWTFGTNNGSAGLNYLSMIPVDGAVSQGIGLDNHNGVIAGGQMPLNQQICLTATYNYSAQTAAIYVNGRKTGGGTVTAPINTIPDGDNYIGKSQYNDPYWAGTIDEFRIYSGVVSDFQLALDAAAGPNNIVTNTGALLSVAANVGTNVDVHAAGASIQVLATFANVSNVDVTTLPQTTITSGNTSIGTIANGNFVPQNAGLSLVTAAYGGVTNSISVTVVDTNAWPTLLHRWRFNEPSGSTTLTDVVGTVNGTIYGPAVFDGQKMTTPLPGGNPDQQQFSNSGPNGTPSTNAVWVSYPSGTGMVTGLPNEASLEIWVVWNGSQEWAELWDFGQSASPGVSTGGGNYVMVTAQDNTGVMRAEWDQNGNPFNYDVLVEAPTILPTNTLCQIVYSHDQDRQTDKLYLNGQLVSSAVNTALWSTLPDTDNWLARDEWPDPVFSGQYWDFRIWNGALTAGQVANLYAAGPAAVAGPALHISASGGSRVTLAWPANATTFTLQSSTNLVGNSWSNVPGTPTVTNGLNNLTIQISQSQTFYRLTP